MRKFFRRKKGKENNKNIKKEEVFEEKKETLVLCQDDDRTSVFYNGKEVLRHEINNPFLAVELGYSNKKVIKVFPLSNVIAEKLTDKVKLSFSNKGYRATVEVIDNNEAVKIKIKKNDKSMLIINFPRGTNEKISHYIGKNELKNTEKQYLTTRISNFYSDKGLFYSLKTAKEWDIEISDKYKKMKIRGEKAKIYIVFGKDKEETIKEHRKREKIKKLEVLEKKVFITLNKEKITEKIEKYKKMNIPFDGVVIENIEKIEDVKALIAVVKEKKLETIIKAMPYIKRKKELEQHFIKNKNGDFYEEEINGQMYCALNLTDKETRRYIQNKIREMLDVGIKGIIAEKGYIDSINVVLPREENFSYAEVWYILWQKLIKEVIDEYPNRLLLLRNCGAKSPHYGYVMTDESKWADIEKNRIQLRLEKMKDCGMGEIITEIGGLENEKEKKFKHFSAWLELVKEMPVIIFGNIPDKVLKKNIEEIKQRLSK